MCVGVPAKVVELLDEQDGIVELDGVRRAVSLVLVPGILPGEHVIVHAGFAIQRLDEEEALETLKILREMAGQTALPEPSGGIHGP